MSTTTTPAPSVLARTLKFFRKSGVEITRSRWAPQEGSPLPANPWWTFSYGFMRGSRTFSTLAEMRADALPWIAERRKQLVAEAAELEQVERYLTRLTEES